MDHDTQYYYGMDFLTSTRRPPADGYAQATDGTLMSQQAGIYVDHLSFGWCLKLSALLVAGSGVVMVAGYFVVADLLSKSHTVTHRNKLPCNPSDINATSLGDEFKPEYHPKCFIKNTGGNTECDKFRIIDVDPDTAHATGFFNNFCHVSCTANTTANTTAEHTGECSWHTLGMESSPVFVEEGSTNQSGRTI